VNVELKRHGQGSWLLLWVILQLLPTTLWAAQTFTSGLLFRIQLAGSEPSYLFGTIHSEDERVLALPAVVREAFESTERVAVEITPDPNIAIESMIVMVYSDGRDLPMVVGDALYRRSVEAMARRGIPESVVRQFKPWAVAAMLSAPPAKTGLFLDFFLAQQAASAGREVIGLETLDEQLGVFDNMSDQDQIAILQNTLNYLGQMPTLFKNLLDTYLRRDLQGLVDLNEQSAAGSDRALSARIQEAMVYRRNRTMVERLIPHMQNGSIFAAVGALHLPGERGMLRLFVERGARVERVY